MVQPYPALWHQGPVVWTATRPQTAGVEGGFGTDQAYWLYCALYLCHCYICATSDRQTLDPGDWGPLAWTMASGRECLFMPFTIFTVPDTQLLSDKTPGA